MRAHFIVMTCCTGDIHYKMVSHATRVMNHPRLKNIDTMHDHSCRFTYNVIYVDVTKTGRNLLLTRKLLINLRVIFQ